MTKGSPMRLMLVFSLPLLIGNVFQQFYNMADTVIVGRAIGVHALAAVGLSGALLFLVFGFFFGFTGGLSVITGQRIGAKDRNGVRKSIATSTMLCTAVTLIATVLSVALTPWILRVMRTPAEILRDATVYLLVLFGGMFTIVAYNMLASMIRALGDSRTPIVFLVFACVMNVILDLLFILVFGWGVAGAGIATVFSQLLAAALCYFYARRHFPEMRLHKRDWKFDSHFAWEHLRVALPMAFQFSVTAVGVVILQAVLNRFGATAVAAFTAGARIDQLFIQPAFSFSMAMNTFAAQNFGAGDFDRIRTGTTKCSQISIIASWIGTFVVLFFAPELTRCFVKPEEFELLYPQVRTFLWCASPFYSVLSLLLIYRNSLQGMGYALVPFLAGVAELLVRSFFAPWFGGMWGYTGVCLSNTAAWFGAVIPLGVWYFLIIRKYTGKLI